MCFLHIRKEINLNIYNVWFARVEIANSTKLKLLEEFTTDEIWNFSREDLLDLGIKESGINQILKQEYREKLDKYCKYLEKNKIELITYKNKDYPYKLKNIMDLPAYIFVKGNKNILDDDSVAIIGSRLCSKAGKKIAFNTAKELGDKNINVVSGLANRNRYLCSYW